MGYAASRRPTSNEEFANALSHGLGAVLAAAFSPQLIANALHAGVKYGIAASVYCASMILLFSVSAAYHWLPRGATKDLLRRLDHAAIFLFIAGSYTPFVLGSLAEEGYWFLAAVWTIAVVGTVAKCANRLTHPLASTATYLGLGWLCVFILQPLMTSLPPQGLALLVTGGVLYTLGAVVFHFDDRIAYGHLAWHLLVLGASGCHFVALLRYVNA
ncbi:MAG TPA: hemolysin III family protein [Ramlibacter sp.]|uniref:PAQR family membrane homeostasis protein TrhA n=1 Tax=Ramlibacter sp. TaxID=1917967 RepID=UPI002D7F7FB5|nr:hemolysin III family protein [Ramlibacter sp.]HET8747153.1 hemolysin III family protein [Ramlibacter sp.]